MDEEGAVRIAAGADKLLVLYVDKKILNRYSLTTMKKEASIDLPFEGKVMAMAIGSASHGPLYLVGEKRPLTGVTLLMDVQRMAQDRTGNEGEVRDPYRRRRLFVGLNGW